MYYDVAILFVYIYKGLATVINTVVYSAYAGEKPTQQGKGNKKQTPINA